MNAQEYAESLDDDGIIFDKIKCPRHHKKGPEILCRTKKFRLTGEDDAPSRPIEVSGTKKLAGDLWEFYDGDILVARCAGLFFPTS